MDRSPDATSSIYGHPGEQDARARFSGSHPIDPVMMKQLMHDHLAPSWAAFMEAMPFFFLSTANAQGHCDASFRGRDTDASGRPLALLKVIDERNFMFPDLRGNNMFATLGNMLVNPNVGLLFIDFTHARRLRVNGEAEILEGSDQIRDSWPQTDRGVMVRVTQAFPNCNARIPRMIASDEEC